MKHVPYSEVEKLARHHSDLSVGWVDSKKYAYYAITHHSTAIEGSTLTESQVIDLLEYGKTVPQKPFEHHLMAFDHQRALEFVAMTALDHRTQVRKAVTIPFLQDIATAVMRTTGGKVSAMLGDFDTSKGDLRLAAVRAGSRYFPDPKKVPALLKEFCKTTNDALGSAKGFQQQTDAAFDAHFGLVSIHPFGDGNGRSSRLLMNYIQALFGWPMSVVFKADRLAYIDALEASRKNESHEPFRAFMLAQYAKFLKKEIKELKR